MAHQKTTPEKKSKRNYFIEPRRPFIEEESASPRTGKKNNYKHRDSSTIAVVNPRMIQKTSTPVNIVQTYRSSTVSQYRPPFSIEQVPVYTRAPPIISQYLHPRPVYAVRYTQPPPMPVPVIPHYPPPPIRSYYPDTRWCTLVTPTYAIPVPAMPVPIYSCASRVCPYSTYLGPAIVTGSSECAVPISTTETFENRTFGPNFEAVFFELQRTELAPPMYAENNDHFNGNNFDDIMTDRLINSPVLSPKQTKPLDPEKYLQLPRNLFPTARTLRVDPNPIIDQFCRINDYEKITLWILDLEFGVPKGPITRPIPTYNVQFHSIHCKNTPGAVHPGFESCSYDFKNMFLFYYDCAVSAWYRGFVIMNSDRSVDNFQSWLDVPMKVFGMCWP